MMYSRAYCQAPTFGQLSEEEVDPTQALADAQGDHQGFLTASDRFVNATLVDTALFSVLWRC